MSVSSDSFHLLPLFAFEVVLSEWKPFSLPSLSTPLFVSWHLLDGTLRGCIGTFQPYPLATAIQTFTIKSAFEDPRFNRIVEHELEALVCKISLLDEFESILDPYDWEDGLHGLQISFLEGGCKYSSTFLPEVSVEQGWTQLETIHRLIKKSGFKGLITKGIIAKLQITKYKSRQYKATYSDYVKYISRMDQ